MKITDPPWGGHPGDRSKVTDKWYSMILENLMADFNWVCPHCEHAVTISDERISKNIHPLTIPNADSE
jgi:hypothetical protein